MATDVEYYTRLAAEKLNKRQDGDAVTNFKEAVEHAEKLHDVEAICKCKFNLGAALVALGRASEGLKLLEFAVPSQHDCLLTGDLHYNLCLAHETLDHRAEAISCIQKAIKCYSECSDTALVTLLKAGSYCRLGFLYTKLQKFEPAAEAYADAACSYGTANVVPQQASCLFQQARMLGCCCKDADAIVIADRCAKLCLEYPDAGVGKLVFRYILMVRTFEFFHV